MFFSFFVSSSDKVCHNFSQSIYPYRKAERGDLIP